jgi:hypothetical protein
MAMPVGAAFRATATGPRGPVPDITEQILTAFTASGHPDAEETRPLLRHVVLLLRSIEDLQCAFNLEQTVEGRIQIRRAILLALVQVQAVTAANNDACKPMSLRRPRPEDPDDDPDPNATATRGKRAHTSTSGASLASGSARGNDSASHSAIPTHLAHLVLPDTIRWLIHHEVDLVHWPANLDPTGRVDRHLHQADGEVARIHVLRSTVLPPGQITRVAARFGRHVGTEDNWHNRNWQATAHPVYPNEYKLGSEGGILEFGTGLPPKQSGACFREVVLMIWSRSPVAYRLPAGLPYASVRFTKGGLSQSRGPKGLDEKGVERVVEATASTWDKADGQTYWFTSGHEARRLTRLFNDQLQADRQATRAALRDSPHPEVSPAGGVPAPPDAPKMGAQPHGGEGRPARLLG